jgi:hypothetical protein
MDDTTPLCCSSMAWIKAFAATAHSLVTTGATCSEGTAFEGRLWDDVTEAEIEAEPCPSSPVPCSESSDTGELNTFLMFLSLNLFACITSSE